MSETPDYDELRELVVSFVLAEIDYMRRNNLGDPEKQHNIKRARQLGITDGAAPLDYIAAISEEQLRRVELKPSTLRIIQGLQEDRQP